MDDVILCHLHYLSLSLQMVERKGNLFSLHHYRCSVPLNWIADFLVFQSWSIFHGHWSESIDHALIRLSEGSKRSTVIVRTKVTGTSLSLNAHVAHQSGHCVFNWRRDDRTRLCTSQMENVHEDDTAPNWPMESSRFEFNVSQRERERERWGRMPSGCKDFILKTFKRTPWTYIDYKILRCTWNCMRSDIWKLNFYIDHDDHNAYCCSNYWFLPRRNEQRRYMSSSMTERERVNEIHFCLRHHLLILQMKWLLRRSKRNFSSRETRWVALLMSMIRHVFAGGTSGSGL